MDLNNLSTNWRKLQATISTQQDTKSVTLKHGLKRKRDHTNGLQPNSHQHNHRNRSHVTRKMASPGSGPSAARKSGSQLALSSGQGVSQDSNTKAMVNTGFSSTTELGKYIALDCEMVGVGPDPDRKSALARASIVNYNGEQVYDSYVKPLEPVTDWRTHVSGVAPRHMAQARAFQEVQAEVAGIIKDKVLIGHAIRNDLDALLLDHPKRDIRDTARHAAHRKLSGGSAPRLKILASELLGLQIQEGEHSSIDDARACMLLFRRDKAGFEREHAKKWPALPPPRAEGDGSGSRPKTKKKKKKK